MKPIKVRFVKWYFIALGTVLAIAPTLVVFAGGGSATD